MPAEPGGPAEGRWHQALPSDDLAVGAIVPARLGPWPVLLGRLSDGQAVAFGSRCPHQDTPLAEAGIWDDKVRCRQHQYLYDPHTGENVIPARTAPRQNLWKLRPGYLPTYGVEERDGWVWVFDQPNPPPAAYDPADEEPPLWAAPPPATAAPADEEDEGAGPAELVKTVRVRVGSTFALRLPINPLPGCVWETEVAGDRLEVVDEGLGAARPGSLDPPRWQVRLAAREEGEAEVLCLFRAPWDVEPSEIRRYRVLIVS